MQAWERAYGKWHPQNSDDFPWCSCYNTAHYRYISSITVPFQNIIQKEEDTGNISVVGDDLLQNSNSNEGIIDGGTNKNINTLSNHSIEGEDNLADDLEYGNVEETCLPNRFAGNSKHSFRDHTRCENAV